MEECHWDEIDGFNSPSEFNRFRKWMDDQVSMGLSKQVPVTNFYAGENLSETWFMCTDCGMTWRLVEPDPGYFNGIFCRVS